MDPHSPRQGGEAGEHISALINEFFDRRNAGEDLTREEFLAEHPEAADVLESHLEGLSLFDKACGGVDRAGGDGPGRRRRKLPAVEGFELIEEIGRGGMGVVYKALQLSTKRVVALKVMLASVFASPTARRRFDREVELAARLQHEGIVRVLESGDVAGQRFYAMDHVQGVRLDDYLSASKPEIRRLLGLFVEICEAVEFAHCHGVIHRDLKPANVLIDDGGKPRILDFGLAKATDEAGTEETLTAYVSLPGQVVGTLFYLSPEQAGGDPDGVDARTDVYALGVMLFEALTGALPFDTSGRPSEVIKRILETAPTPPRSLSELVDDDLETIILKALEKERDRRYQSAKELAEDLRRYLANDPIFARRPSSLYILRKKLRKHRIGALVSTGVIVLVVAGVSAGLWWWRAGIAEARRTALQLQRDLEAGEDVRSRAGELRARYPHLPEAHLVHAQANYRRQRAYGGSVSALETELRRDPAQWVYSALLAELYRAGGDAERAAAHEARAARDAPDTAEAWYLRSFATLDIQQARRCVEEAVRRRPSHALAWERLTHLYVQAGDLDSALRGVNALVALSRRPSDWYHLKGSILGRQGRFQAAVAVLPKPCRNRAAAYRRLKEYAKAVADYTWMVESWGGEEVADVWLFYQRATPLWILGRREEAVEDYRRVQIRFGRPYYSDARRYFILHELKRNAEAEDVLSAALRDVKEPWLKQIFRCLADELAPEELVADAADHGTLEQLCEAYYYAGEVCLLANRRDEARNWFESCMRTGLDYDPDTALGTPMNEYELAEWRLEKLFGEQVPTSQP